MKNNVVRKHNDIVEACYSMSTPELRLIYSCISKIDFDKTINKDQPFFISAMDYSETFGVSQKHVHSEIKKAVDSIWDAEIIIQRENKKPLTTRWISSKAEYEDGGAEIRFASDVIPYLVNLQKGGNFTMYKLKNIGGLKSAYGIRLYEILVQYKVLGSREITLSKFREILGLGNKYKAMCDLRKRVLDSAIKEINAVTDLKVSYKNIKRGRSIIAFNFTIKGKKKASKPIKEWGYMSNKEIERQAKPGETWEQAEQRVKRVKRLLSKQLKEEQQEQKL